MNTTQRILLAGTMPLIAAALILPQSHSSAQIASTVVFGVTMAFTMWQVTKPPSQS